MTVQCIACTSFAFPRKWSDKGPPLQFAQEGFGTCKHRPEPGRAVSATYARECDKWAAGDPETVTKLRAWLAKQHQGGKA